MEIKGNRSNESLASSGEEFQHREYVGSDVLSGTMENAAGGRDSFVARFSTAGEKSEVDQSAIEAEANVTAEALRVARDELSLHDIEDQMRFNRAQLNNLHNVTQQYLAPDIRQVIEDTKINHAVLIRFLNSSDLPSQERNYLIEQLEYDLRQFQDNESQSQPRAGVEFKEEMQNADRILQHAIANAHAVIEVLRINTRGNVLEKQQVDEGKEENLSDASLVLNPAFESGDSSDLTQGHSDNTHSVLGLNQEATESDDSGLTMTGNFQQSLSHQEANERYGSFVVTIQHDTDNFQNQYQQEHNNAVLARARGDWRAAAAHWNSAVEIAEAARQRIEEYVRESTNYRNVQLTEDLQASMQRWRRFSNEAHSYTLQARNHLTGEEEAAQNNDCIIS